jgi:SAM-dependent methyltransferase
MGKSQALSFNDAKHVRGEWNTTIAVPRSALLRSCADFLSQKRKGVDELAAVVPSATGMVLDAGAGQGAYGIWFASRNGCSVVGVDSSLEALRRAKAHAASRRLRGKILPVCADIGALPFRQEKFCATFSVDTLGHVADVNKVLDELLRCSIAGAPLFLHSECADYRRRWPDRMLITKLGEDLPARQDGHTGLLKARDLFMLYTRRFRVISFVNPAGYLGWFLGYPEKYRPAFAAAGFRGFALFLGVCAAVKNLPVIGIVLRLVNALSNHLENFLGLTGGGSCFAVVKKPI